MSPTRANALMMSLDEFLKATPDLEAAAIVSSDGLPMATALPNTVEEDRLGAMAAAMLSLGDKAAEALGRGRLQQIFIEGETGYVFLMAAGPAVLCAITRQTAKVGLVLYEMQRSAAQVAQILATHDSAQGSVHEFPVHDKGAATPGM